MSDWVLHGGSAFWENVSDWVLHDGSMLQGTVSDWASHGGSYLSHGAPYLGIVSALVYHDDFEWGHGVLVLEILLRYRQGSGLIDAVADQLL